MIQCLLLLFSEFEAFSWASKFKLMKDKNAAAKVLSYYPNYQYP